MYYASTSGSCSGQPRQLVAVVNDVAPIISRKQAFVQKCNSGFHKTMEVEPGGPLSYSWSPTNSVSTQGAQNQIASVSNSVTVTFTVSGQDNGCVTSETVASMVSDVIAGDLILWMQDFPTDAGTPHTAPVCFNSPDIWLSAVPGGTSVPYGSHIGNVIPHYINVNVHNSTASSQTGLLKVYWAKAGIAQNWSSDWSNKTVTTTATPSIVPAGDMIAAPVFITVPSNTTAVFSLPWVLPNPAWYSDYTNGDLFHFCIVATIETGCNSLPNSTDLNSNVQQSNKFSWKNLDVLMDYYLPKPRNFTAGNFHENNSTFRVIVKSHETPGGTNLLDFAEVSVGMSDEFAAVWDEGGKAGTGILEIAANSVRAIDSNAIIDNLAFAAQQKVGGYFNVLFTAQAPLTYSFEVDLMEFEEHGSLDSTIGGIHYVIVPPVCPDAIAEQETIILDPDCHTDLIAQNQQPGVIYGWYDANGILQPGDGTANVSPDTSTYYVLRAEENGCRITDTTYIIVTAASGCLGRSLAQSDFTNAGLFQLIPNPASDRVTCNVNNVTKEDRVVHLSNAYGQMVASFELSAGKGETTIDCSKFPAGIYFVWLEDESRRHRCEKLILTR